MGKLKDSYEISFIHIKTNVPIDIFILPFEKKYLLSRTF